ncbi:hypothetical protein Emin_0803 [Elusimicrobium minutum Pei191]|uniref:Uncharacterized protein n=1 Tax=Elusimicrobium minutum (strain Pei191) TaxID=445932 RepID=B2KCW2_ELUMP|nr:hypothetical protein [Elusimicrobium minutum]ACC98358.1 hypothetical protein Emin_0803 [Elusimicrobium minutum Pei191]
MKNTKVLLAVLFLVFAITAKAVPPKNFDLSGVSEKINVLLQEDNKTKFKKDNPVLPQNVHTNNCDGYHCDAYNCALAGNENAPAHKKGTHTNNCDGYHCDAYNCALAGNENAPVPPKHKPVPPQNKSGHTNNCDGYHCDAYNCALAGNENAPAHNKGTHTNNCDGYHCDAYNCALAGNENAPVPPQTKQNIIDEEYFQYGYYKLNPYYNSVDPHSVKYVQTKENDKDVVFAVLKDGRIIKKNDSKKINPYYNPSDPHSEKYLD